MDYPANWSLLMPTLLTSIQSGNVAFMYNALYALRKIIKRFEFKSDDDREPLNNIIAMTFPLLQALLATLVISNSMEAAQMMKICFKIFHSCTCYKLPSIQGVDVNFWFTTLATILEKPLPEASEGIEPTGQPEDIDERKTWGWWKLKKWAARVIALFIQRYMELKCS